MPERDYKFCPMCATELVSRELGGRARHACPRPGCGFVAWGNPVPVVAAIVEHREEVVLVRSHGWPETWFGLVAGFLEKGEHPDTAVLREVEEELGLTARDPRLIGSYAFERMNQIIFVYHVRPEDGSIRLCERELAAYKSVPLARLRPWSQGTGPALRDWLASRGFHPPVVEFGQHIAD